MSERKLNWKALLIGAGALAIAGLAVWGIFEALQAGTEDERVSISGLSVLLVGGIVVFILALGGLVAIFHGLELTTKSSPLGLPNGSIQAFMALVLILLFFIMSVFLYTDITRPTTNTAELTGLSQSQFDSIPATKLVSSNSYDDPQAPQDAEVVARRFDVTVDLTGERSQVADEVARQLITTIGTLIVAIASFYFGARSIGGGPQTPGGQPGQPSAPHTG